MSGSTPEDNPGVRVPPPVFVLAAILLGAGIDRLVPLRFLPESLAPWTGGTLVVLAVALAGLGMREFRKARTAIRPDQPAAALVTSGPYRRTRNPMYIALSILLVGIGAWMNSAWVLALLVPVLALIHFGVIPREERYLARRFGQAYLDYRARVRRWL
jgi:protein-S-isoprenylcysteine O-methyltransferase Ste14